MAFLEFLALACPITAQDTRRKNNTHLNLTVSMFLKSRACTKHKGEELACNDTWTAMCALLNFILYTSILPITITTKNDGKKVSRAIHIGAYPGGPPLEGVGFSTNSSSSATSSENILRTLCFCL